GGDVRTTGGHRRAAGVPAPGIAATVTMTDEEFLRSGGRVRARRASGIPVSEEDQKRLPAFLVPLIGVGCVAAIAGGLFVWLPGGGSDKAADPQDNVSVQPSGEADAGSGGGEEASTTKKKPKQPAGGSATPSRAPSSTPSAAASASPSASASAASTPSTKPKPGTLRVSGCDVLIEVGSTRCTLLLTASGGDVAWKATPGAHLSVGKRSGTLTAGRSVSVTVTVTRSSCDGEATSTVVLSPGGSRTIRWECETEIPIDENPGDTG
ncbi:hypothetical protein, partial [Actinocorallia lasiicapitis]